MDKVNICIIIIVAVVLSACTGKMIREEANTGSIENSVIKARIKVAS